MRPRDLVLQGWSPGLGERHTPPVTSCGVVRRRPAAFSRRVNAELGTDHQLFGWDRGLNKFSMRDEVRRAILGT